MSRNPPCPYVDRCGGCSLQDTLYDDQLLLKQGELSRIFGKDISMHAAPEGFGYRSRMDFIICSDGLGLREKGKSFSIVPLDNCLLLSKNANIIFSKIKDLIVKSDLSVYDLRSHKGFLRYLTLREDAHGKIMILLTTVNPDETTELKCVSLIDAIASLVESTYWLVHSGKADDIFSSKIKLYKGKQYLTESIFGNSFSIAPMTFFQSNRQVAKMMFSAIKEHVSGRTLDLYCGVGAISLSVSSVADEIIGVECVADSILAAKKNALKNKINASFFTESVDEFVKFAVLAKEKFDTIIVDPPRTGLGSFVARGLPLLGAKKIVYMSCNPKSMRNDLQPLLKYYNIISLEGFDMFPQTAHVEVLCVLGRKRVER